MLTRLCKATFAPLFAVALMLLPSSASAASTMLETVQEAGGPLGTLQASGVEVRSILSAERRPDGAYVVEAGVDIAGTTARYPVVLSRNDDGFTLDWQPGTEYAEALENVLREGQLPAVDTGISWVGEARLPALPVILESHNTITPFGTFERTYKDHDVYRGNNVPLSKGLGEHAKRWREEVLAGDEDAASIDLLVESRQRWLTLVSAIRTGAKERLWKVRIITRSGDIVALRAPPWHRHAIEESNLIVSVFANGWSRDPATNDDRVDDVSIDVFSQGAKSPPADGCKRALCLVHPTQLPDRLAPFLKLPPSPRRPSQTKAHVELTKELNVGQGVPWLAFVQRTLDLAPYELSTGLASWEKKYP